jgi:hypothetical protein
MAKSECVLVLRIDEETGTSNQALRGLGCRPSPSYVVLALSRMGFAHIYAPRTPPANPDFIFGWKHDLSFSRDNHLLRCVFIASKQALQHSNVLPLL